MKNLKFLSLSLLCGIIVLAWCEKVNNPEKNSCDTDDICPIETNIDDPSQKNEEELSNASNKWNLEWDLSTYEWLGIKIENYEQPADEPMMRKIVVDENATPEEIEQDMVETCENLWWTRTNWTCTLDNGSQIAF